MLWVEIGLAAGAIFFLMLVLRFVQPEILYGLRTSVVEARKNKAFLLWDEGKTVSLFGQLLMRDLRPEGVPRNLDDVFPRVTKIRELDAVLGSSHHGVSELPQFANSNICVLELANIIRDLSKRVRPSARVSAQVMHANQHLERIGAFPHG